MKKVVILIIALAIAAGGYFVYLSEQSANTATSPTPVINVMDILHASDLSAGVKKAVINNDEAAIQGWLEKARHVGEEAGLPESDLQYLTSKQAENFVKFNANRDLFNDAFEARYYNLQGIDDLKKRYPEAKDLFERAEALLDKRDRIIRQIATTLANGKTPSQTQIEKAQAMWQARYKEKQTATTALSGKNEGE